MSQATSPATSAATSPVSFPAGTWLIYMYGAHDQPPGIVYPPTNWTDAMTINLYEYGDVGHAPSYGGTVQVMVGLRSPQVFALENVTFNPDLGVLRFRIQGLATAMGVTNVDVGSNFRFTFEGTYSGTPSTEAAAFTGGEAWVPPSFMGSLNGGGSGGGGDDDSNATWTGSQGG